VSLSSHGPSHLKSLLSTGGLGVGVNIECSGSTECGGGSESSSRSCKSENKYLLLGRFKRYKKVATALVSNASKVNDLDIRCVSQDNTRRWWEGPTEGPVPNEGSHSTATSCIC
jgi:hypothetical protein